MFGTVLLGLLVCSALILVLLFVRAWSLWAVVGVVESDGEVLSQRAGLSAHPEDRPHLTALSRRRMVETAPGTLRGDFTSSTSSLLPAHEQVRDATDSGESAGPGGGKNEAIDPEIERFEENAAQFERDSVEFARLLAERGEDEAGAQVQQSELNGLLAESGVEGEVQTKCSGALCEVTILAEDSVAGAVRALAPWMVGQERFSVGDPRAGDDPEIPAPIGMRLFVKKATSQPAESESPPESH